MWQLLAQASDAAPSILERFGPVFVPVGVILAAIIAGSFAVRNARKTPHEQLKTLVEIREKLHVVDTHVIDAAIDREIAKIDRLNAARIEGFWQYAWQRLKEWYDDPATGVPMLITIVAGLVALASSFLFR